MTNRMRAWLTASAMLLSFAGSVLPAGFAVPAAAEAEICPICSSTAKRSSAATPGYLTGIGYAKPTPPKG